MIEVSKILVLFREPDTMALYGIPYRMREGQQPGDLWRRYGTPRAALSDWVWLGSPGWWGSITPADRERIETWLEDIRLLVPQGPYEWTDLTKERS
jgi:hypothetical protein